MGAFLSYILGVTESNEDFKMDINDFDISASEIQRIDIFIDNQTENIHI